MTESGELSSKTVSFATGSAGANGTLPAEIGEFEFTESVPKVAHGLMRKLKD